MTTSLRNRRRLWGAALVIDLPSRHAGLARLARQRRAGTHDIRRRDRGVIGEGEEKPFILRDILQYPGEKSRVAGGGANRVGAEAGERKKTPQVLRLAGSVLKR